MGNLYRVLRDEIDEERRCQIEALQQDYDKKIGAIDADFRNRRNALQATCPHDNERAVDAFDYHKREDWTSYYCDDCGKYLRTV